MEAPGATGDYHTDLTSKARTALSYLLPRSSSAAAPAGLGAAAATHGAPSEGQARAGGGQLADAAAAGREGEFDLGFVHIKAVDDAGHDKSCSKKVPPTHHPLPVCRPPPHPPLPLSPSPRVPP